MNIICFGDSLTNGDIGYSYRNYLNNEYNTINKGIDGDTTEGMYLRLKNYLNKDDENKVYIILLE